MAGSATITGTQNYIMGIGHPKTEATTEAPPAVLYTDPLTGEVDFQFSGGSVGNRMFLPVLAAEIPAGLGWDSTTYPFTPRLSVGPRFRNYGQVDGVDTFLASHFSDCLAATPIYINATTGNDTTGNGTSGNPYATINKGMLIANAAAVPAHIMIAGGVTREYNLSAGFNGSATQPTVKTVFSAYNGRVKSTTKYIPTWGALDGTYTNCYVAAIATTMIGRLVPRRMTNLATGEYLEATRVATPAIANTRPGTYCVSGTNLYYNPMDGVAPTSSNTYVYQAGTGNFRTAAATPVSVWLRSLTSGDGFDLEGGSTGAFRAVYTSKPASPIVVAMDNCTMRYAGTTTGSTNVGVQSRQVAVDAVHGIFIARNSHCGSSGDDAWNLHNTLEGSAVVMYSLTLNCSSSCSGIYDATLASFSTSNNGWTTHENVIAMDVAGKYQNSFGRAVFSVNTSKSLLVGTIAESSYGDTPYSGGYIPAEFAVANTAQYWLDQCEPRPLCAATPAYAVDDTAQMHLRRCFPVANNSVVASGATLDSY